MYGTVPHSEQKPVEENKKILQFFAGAKKYGGKKKDKDEDSIKAGGCSGREQCTHTQLCQQILSSIMISGFVYHDLLPHWSEKRYFYAAKVCRFRTDSSDRAPKL